MSGNIVLAAGGTGGHLFPAEAVARALLGHRCAVHLLTDGRAETFAERLPEIALHRVCAGRLGGGPVRAAYGLAELAVGVVQARRLLRRLAPDAVIGFGGYPSVPTMLAAAQLGLPTVIHEQNAVAGRANRLLAPRMNRIAIGFPVTNGLRGADRTRAIHTGNPVRPAILALGGTDYAAPSFDGPIELLIIGGSQGARILSEVVPPALAALSPELRDALRLSQQARPEDLAAVAEQHRAHGIAAELAPFFSDMPERLRRAHLVIARSGASTIAELAAAGRPAVLIPYPHAMDDHQTANARAFAEAGGGWVIPQAVLNPGILADLLSALLAHPERLQKAAAQASEFARRDAAARLAELALVAGSVAECAA
jgi:UDP-N-acetylglucosamine--N-acetylmuramyl-(pentapeptide) pyrophosphoryl-undecaprenol N-acetylglucosamine transferase